MSIMKRLRVIALAAFSTGAIQAQDISGAWQGTLQARDASLRIVMKIARSFNEDGAFSVTMYSIDQGPGSNQSSSLTLQDSNLKISFPGIGGTYEGKLNADGNSIAGTW